MPYVPSMPMNDNWTSEEEERYFARANAAETTMTIGGKSHTVIAINSRLRMNNQPIALNIPTAPPAMQNSRAALGDELTINVQLSDITEMRPYTGSLENLLKVNSEFQRQYLSQITADFDAQYADIEPGDLSGVELIVGRTYKATSRINGNSIIVRVQSFIDEAQEMVSCVEHATNNSVVVSSSRTTWEQE